MNNSLNGVMLPSDLEGTHLENAWVKGRYDHTLEENQDENMNRFWYWCEHNCVSKGTASNGFTYYNFK